MNESYFAIATLTGIDASLSVAVSIGTQQLEDLKRFREEDIDSDDSPEILIMVELRFFSKEETSSCQNFYSIWSDSIYDLLDLSICMSHLADKNDTTERLAANGSREKYSHRAQWELVQRIFNWTITVSSKLTPKFVGKKFVSIWFETDASTPNQYTLLTLVAFFEETKRFAEELRQIYEDIEAIN